MKRGGPLSFLVGTISNVLVMEIGWTDVGSGGYILVSCAHSNTSFKCLCQARKENSHVYALEVLREQSCVCARGNDYVSVSMIFLLHFRTVLGVWYILFFILSWYVFRMKGAHAGDINYTYLMAVSIVHPLFFHKYS